MRTLFERLAVATTLVFVALVVSPDSGTLALGIAVVLLVSAVRSAAAVGCSLEVTVGSRARAHRESLSVTPAPRHPSTAGLPRTRAPSRALAA